MDREPARIRVILETGEESYEAKPLELKDGDHIEDILDYIWGNVNAIICEHMPDEDDE